MNGHRVTAVQAGKTFHRIDADTFAINPEIKEDYRALLRELKAGGQSPDNIAHLWCLTGRDKGLSVADSYRLIRRVGFNSLLFLTQAIREHLPRQSMQIKVISNHLQDVTGDEFLSPAKAILLGPCLVIPQEHPNMRCTSIDLEDGRPAEVCAEFLLKELSAGTADAVVAYRGKRRWVRAFEPVLLAKNARIEPNLREGGVYLITGGLGGIGLELAGYLAKAARAKLVLISRTGLPDRGQWQHWLETHKEQDAVSQKIRKVKAIENEGSQVLVLRADVCNFARMKAAIGHAQDRFGRIHGVIHAAGIAGGGPMRLKEPEAAASVLAPKVEGTLVLGELLRETRLDWVVLCSSLSAHLGGIERVDYCSANAFLDAYAQSHLSEQNLISVNWCAWQGIGMASNTEVPADLKGQSERNLLLGTSPEEGRELFGRILGMSHSQIAVSLQDLTALLQGNDESKESIAVEPVKNSPLGEPVHPRPDLSSDYVAPGNSTEQTIADIWQGLLGVANVGIHDNFFELGGHSLLATGLVARLKSVFPVELSVASLFENPTVHSLSDMVRQSGRNGSSFNLSRSRGQMRKERVR
jgi:NAD(P)-dependent dehydrogenase (short-subunit alcohol dehydrogenase family)